MSLPAPGGFLHLFRAIAATEPSRVFAVCDRAPLTFGMLDQRSDRFAAALRARGVMPGDRVAVMLPNGVAAVALIYAIAKAGAVWVPLNVQAVGDSLRYILGHAQPKLVIAAEGLAAEGITPEALEATPGAAFDPVDPAPEADFAIGYTSGTTGAPKGVRVSHRMLRLSGEGAVLASDARDGDVMFLWEPLYHIGGAQMTIVPLLKRAVLHMVPRFSASRFWEEVVAAGATHIHYLGGILQILLKQPPSPSERAHRVRVAWGAACPADSWREIERRFGLTVRECYGMTENSSFSSFNGSGLVGSVGKAVPWFDIELLDPQGKPVPQGERGEIVVRSRDPHAITKGYLNNPEATARALKDGAMFTGDHGSLDADGNLFFHGRMSDSIRVRGENVGAWEVETVVSQHPAVADCAAIGVAAEIGEQDIKLFVQTRPDATLAEAELRDWLATRLARYQQPRHIVFVAEFERTPSQRIMKHRLPR